MNSRIPSIDADLLIQPAVTKTADFDGPALDLGAGYAPGGLGEIFGAVVVVTAIDRTTADETYAFTLQQSDNGSTGWAAIGVVVNTTTTGTIVVKGIVTTRYVRLVLDVNGTTPSITYSANLGM